MAREKMVLSREELNEWAERTLEMIMDNFRVQQVFPFEVYPGFLEKNTRSRGWKSTGAAQRSLHWKVAEYANFSDMKISFFFNTYLRYVDMGVGSGFTIDKVPNRDVDVARGVRFHEWKKSGDRGARPVLMSVFNYRRKILNWMIRVSCEDEFDLLMVRTSEEASKIFNDPLIEL